VPPAEFVPNAARTQLPLTQISSPGRAFSVINASNPLPAPVLIGDQLSTRPLPLELISLPGNLTPNTTGEGCQSDRLLLLQCDHALL
jgi:hypothetical protein